MLTRSPDIARRLEAAVGLSLDLSLRQASLQLRKSSLERFRGFILVPRTFVRGDMWM
jgi:hypothetical protein